MDAGTLPSQAAIVTLAQAQPIKRFGLDMKVLVLAWHKPGEGPPTHVHFSQDEVLFILEGMYEVTVSDQTSTIGAGAAVFIPRNTAHLTNVGDKTGSMLGWSLPGGQDHYLTTISELAASGGFTSGTAMEISKRFDTHFLAGA